jgi:Domain of unknown function (DUF6249)
MDGYIVAVVFWIFVGTTAVTGMILEHKKRRLGVDLLRAAVERGQPLDPATVEKLVAQDSAADEPLDPLALKLGGIITVAAGIGLLPLAYCLSLAFPNALYPVIGAGALAICVGIGLLIGARAVARAQAGHPPA